MPRSEYGHLPQDGSSPATLVNPPSRARQKDQTSRVIAFPNVSARAQRSTEAQFTPFDADRTFQPLFWAWYAAGVETVRCAYGVQSLLIRHVFDVSPVSLALRFMVASHDASNTSTTDDNRDLT